MRPKLSPQPSKFLYPSKTKRRQSPLPPLQQSRKRAVPQVALGHCSIAHGPWETHKSLNLSAWRVPMPEPPARVLAPVNSTGHALRTNAEPWVKGARSSAVLPQAGPLLSLAGRGPSSPVGVHRHTNAHKQYQSSCAIRDFFLHSSIVALSFVIIRASSNLCACKKRNIPRIYSCTPNKNSLGDFLVP